MTHGTGAFGNLISGVGGDSQGSVGLAFIPGSGQRSRLLTRQPQEVITLTGETLSALRQIGSIPVIAAPIRDVGLHPADISLQRLVAREVGTEQRRAGMTISGIRLTKAETCVRQQGTELTGHPIEIGQMCRSRMPIDHIEDIPA